MTAPLTDEELARLRDEYVPLEGHVVGRLVVEIDRMRAENEQLRVQLAGCGVAALGYGETLGPDVYGWSQSYQDVMDLRARTARLAALLQDANERVAELANEFGRADDVKLRADIEAELSREGG